jgi:hypothetical protein
MKNQDCKGLPECWEGERWQKAETAEDEGLQRTETTSPGPRKSSRKLLKFTSSRYWRSTTKCWESQHPWLRALTLVARYWATGDTALSGNTESRGSQLSRLRVSVTKRAAFCLFMISIWTEQNPPSDNWWHLHCEDLLEPREEIQIHSRQWNNHLIFQ